MIIQLFEYYSLCLNTHFPAPCRVIVLTVSSLVGPDFHIIPRLAFQVLQDLADSVRRFYLYRLVFCRKIGVRTVSDTGIRSYCPTIFTPWFGASCS